MNVNPNQTKPISLGNIFSFNNKSGSKNPEDEFLSRLSDSMRLKKEELALANEIWINVRVATSAKSSYGRHSQWHSNDHEIHRATLQTPSLSRAFKEALSKFRLAKKSRVSDLPTEPTMEVSSKSDAEGNIIIEWSHGYRAKISSSCGCITDWVSADAEAPLLLSPVDLCLYRAPTDNDLGGAVISYASQWKQPAWTPLESQMFTLKS